MGNEQSAPTPRRRPANKLSKPRTNNHSNANLLDRRTSAPPSRRNSVSTANGPTKVRDSVIPDNVLEAIDGKEGKSRRRMSLFRSKSARPQSQTLDGNIDVASSVEPSLVDEPTHRWSREPRVRGNSVTSQSVRSHSVERPEPASFKPLIRSRMSLQTYTHHPRLSLVAELPSPNPQKPIRRLSRYDQEEEPQALTQASRTNSESALYTPIRRRSLLQHGVATRTSFIESDPRSSLPSQTQSITITPPRKPTQELSDDMRKYYYNTSKPTSSPLSSLALLGPNPDFADIGPRTETPTELEHIGAFKLGSLRITNGAASPVPSFRSEDDYISAGNARRSQETNQNQRSHTLSIPADTRKPWIVRAESPLRHSQDLDHKPLTIETHLPHPSHAWFDFDGTEQLLKSTESPTKALELAKDYQQDLALSPFSFDNSPLSSPKLESTSKHTAIEDDLFSAEPSTPRLSERAPRSFDSAYDSGLAPKRLLKGPKDLPPKPLAKADSGYSSNISLRSFKRDSVQVEEVPPTPPKEIPSRVPSSTYSVATAPNEAPSRVPSSTYSIASAYSIASTYSVASASSDLTLRMKRSLPSLPPPPQQPAPAPPKRKAPPAPISPPTRQAPSLPLSPTLNRNKDVPNPPTPDKDTHLSVPAKNRRKSLPTIARNTREESPATSELSTSSSSSRWSSKSKINKRPQSVQPPKPEPVYTVQAFRTPSEQLQIPLPSLAAQRHLEERVETFPVACFPNTYSGHVGLKHSSSKETLGTIFSVGSAEVRDELNFARLQSALPPIPVQPSIPEHPVKAFTHVQAVTKPEYNRRNTFQVAPQAPIAGPEMKESRWGRKSLQMPKSRDINVPRDRSLPRLPVNAILNEDLEDHLTSYSTISSSLGKSPYELAANTIPRSQSAVNDRAKSLTAQFESEAAARFNLSKSTEQKPEPISRIRSYDSIASGNPFSSGNTSRRSHPPQTHTNNSPWRPQPQPQLSRSQTPSAPVPQPQFHTQQQNTENADNDRRYSELSVSRASKSKSPPVSMTTQRKQVPSNLNSQTTPNPTSLPTSSSSQPKSENTQWNTTATAWSVRRKSAGEALQTRKSMEMRPSRPTTAQTQTGTVTGTITGTKDLRGRKSMDSSRFRQGWNVGVGYEDAHAYPSPPRKWGVEGERVQEYNHSYGLSTSASNPHFGSNKENFSHNQAEEYYSHESHELDTSDVNLSGRIHERKTSTSEMLILDRFSGGLGYGYEPGLGLSGSAGMRSDGKGVREENRKSVAVSERWGVDLSDVPVILQRVRVGG